LLAGLFGAAKVTTGHDDAGALKSQEAGGVKADAAYSHR
jgi:hypothetical protein